MTNSEGHSEFFSSITNLDELTLREHQEIDIAVYLSRSETATLYTTGKEDESFFIKQTEIR